jgi:hypothetical protein
VSPRHRPCTGHRYHLDSKGSSALAARRGEREPCPGAPQRLKAWSRHASRPSNMGTSQSIPVNEPAGPKRNAAPHAAHASNCGQPHGASAPTQACKAYTPRSRLQPPLPGPHNTEHRLADSQVDRPLGAHAEPCAVGMRSPRAGRWDRRVSSSPSAGAGPIPIDGCTARLVLDSSKAVHISAS